MRMATGMREAPLETAAVPFPDPLKGPGRVTSMRRTEFGNRLVGGAEGSNHLTGQAVDHVGTTRNALQSYYGPSARVGWHKNHWHVDAPGANFPLYGRQGTRTR